MQAKIRDAQLQKVAVMAVVGDIEAGQGLVMARSRGGGQWQLTVDQLREALELAVSRKDREPEQAMTDVRKKHYSP